MAAFPNAAHKSRLYRAPRRNRGTIDSQNSSSERARALRARNGKAAWPAIANVRYLGPPQATQFAALAHSAPQTLPCLHAFRGRSLC